MISSLRICSFILVSLLATILFSGSVFAQYGRGEYGQCVYSEPCIQSTTVAETPNGLDVAINLTDGQTLPKDGFTITVTPLNGRGATFDYVEFYVDGVLLATVQPGPNGTATWFFNTSLFSSGELKIIVYTNNTPLLTKVFRFKVEAAAPLQSTPTTRDRVVTSIMPGPQDSSWILFIRLLPIQLIIAIPFILLSLLLITIIILFVQAKREAAEITRLRLRNEQFLLLAEEKNSFISLASHYLRTPSTLLGGGADYLASINPPVDSRLLDTLTSSIKTLGIKVEEVLEHAVNNPGLQNIKDATQLEPIKPTWQQPLFWLPVSLALILTAAFTAVVLLAGRNEILGIALLTQAAVFLLLSAGLYVTVRWFISGRRELRAAKLRNDQQAAIDKTRNNLIYEAANSLSVTLPAIGAVISQLPQGSAKNFVTEGYQRIDSVLQRFRDVANVTPPLPTEKFELFTLDKLLTTQQLSLATMSQHSHVSVTLSGQTTTIASQRPHWIAQILAALIDNAYAYSPAGSNIMVNTVKQNDQVYITVKDQGPGVPQVSLSKIFQPFSKVEGALQFDHPGMGMSLYFSRLLLTALGGEITLESGPTGGTAVTIRFPIKS